MLRGTGLAALAVAAGCGAGPATTATRTVPSAHGPIAVPDKAGRVVSLDLSKIQRLLDVGVEPVGVPTGWQPPPDRVEWYAGVAKVGTQASLNVETIAGLRPDLVLGSPQGVSDELYARLSALAPTVVLAAPGAGAEWKELSAADAEAAGRSAGLAAVQQRYDDRVAALRAIGTRKRFAIVYGIPAGAYAFRVESGPGIVLADVGAPFAAESARPGVFQQLSYEDLGRFADADVVLLDAAADYGLRTQPTFTALPGRVAVLAPLMVFSYGEALALLDQLEPLLR